MFFYQHVKYKVFNCLKCVSQFGFYLKVHFYFIVLITIWKYITYRNVTFSFTCWTLF